MSLENRIKTFDLIAEKFDCERPSPLLLAYNIPEHRFKNLQTAAALYMSKCLGEQYTITDEKEILELFEEKEQEILNMTPNGMIVPKRHLILEYNLLVKAYGQIIDDLNISGFIDSYHIPLNLRCKYGKSNEENLKRNFPTEHIHSDSWAGESTESVTTLMYIFGDIERNHMRFYDPPAEFDEAWLGPRGSYKEAEEVASKYTLNPFIPKKGQLLLGDFSSLHASTRLEGAGTRISIDTTFSLNRPNHLKNVPEQIHPWRENERATPDTIFTIGEEKLLVFSDKIGENVEVKSGHKHPTTVNIVNLQD